MIACAPACLLSLPLLVACSSSASRPSPIGGGCTVNCGGSTGGGGDSGAVTDSATDASFSETGVSVVGIVHQLGSFPKLANEQPQAAKVSVSGPKIGGGTLTMVAPDMGPFTLDGIAPSLGTPTWLSVSQTGVLRGLVGVLLPASGAEPLPLAIFDVNLPSTIAGAMPIVGRATIVLHVQDKLGNRLAGVSAAPLDTSSPFYDSGPDAVEPSSGKSATGMHGTIVFVSLTPGSSAVNLSFMGTARPTLSVPTAADAISWTTVTVE